MKKEQIINNYLYFGYLPPKSIPTWLNSAFKPSEAFDYSVKGTSALFDKTFDELVSQHSDSSHLIPLSGGWDSRAILGALLERVDRSNIETVTFGTPGQLDYDLGLKIANWAGVKSHAIDLRRVDFTWDKILESVKSNLWSSFPDYLYNQEAYGSIAKNNEVLWSGFLGDALTLEKPSNISEQKINKLIEMLGRNKFNNLIEFDKILLLQQEIINEYKAINKDHSVRLLFLSFVSKFENEILAPLNANTDKKFKVLTPFFNYDWTSYWISSPIETRLNQQLYLQMLNFKFPELFALPSKHSLGLKNKSGVMYHTRRIQQGVVRRIQKRAPWLGIRSTAHLNYLDYDKMFRTRPDYQNTLNEALDYLKENEITPWLPLDKMVKDHMHRKKEYGGAFCVLIGLAANLKVNYDS